jgi:ATP-dependent Clp protease protease subunit
MPNIVQIAGTITPASVGKFMSEVDLESWVCLNSTGGDVLSGLAIFDAIKQLQLDVVVYGSALSIAALILQAGRVRRMTPHSILMLHALIPDQEGSTPATLKLFETLVGIVSKRSGLNSETTRQLFAQETYLTAQEALALNLIDGIVE